MTVEQAARYFYLAKTDRNLIGTLRGDHNWLGFEVILTSLRLIGAFLASAAEE